jgi:hypothetical protein
MEHNRSTEMTQWVRLFVQKKWYRSHWKIDSTGKVLKHDRARSKSLFWVTVTLEFVLQWEVMKSFVWCSFCGEEHWFYEEHLVLHQSVRKLEFFCARSHHTLTAFAWSRTILFGHIKRWLQPMEFWSHEELLTAIRKMKSRDCERCIWELVGDFKDRETINAVVRSYLFGLTFPLSWNSLLQQFWIDFREMTDESQWLGARANRTRSGSDLINGDGI